jgi:hypothetical protein
VALKLIYLVVRNLVGWARLSRRDAVAKDVEILILRHQLAIDQRRAPARELQRKLTWADRAWLVKFPPGDGQLILRPPRSVFGGSAVVLRVG